MGEKFCRWARIRMMGRWWEWPGSQAHPLAYARSIRIDCLYHHTNYSLSALRYHHVTACAT